MKLRTLISAMVMAGMSTGALAVPSGSILGTTGDRPNLSLVEKGAYALIESMLSTVGGLIAFQGCGSSSSTPKVYSTHVFVESINDNIVTGVNGNTTGSRVDGAYFDITAQTHSSNKGTLLWIEDDPNSGSGLINNVAVDDFTTRDPGFGYDAKGSMAYASADMTVGGDFYDEHIIKDFWKRCTGPDNSVQPCQSDPGPTADEQHQIVDFGLELITKLDYPRTKYEQSSLYRRPNNADGWMWIYKTQIAPGLGTLCQIRLNLSIDDLTNTTFEGSGTIATQALGGNPF